MQRSSKKIKIEFFSEGLIFMNEKKVVVGLSGGVDSAVCAAILKERGFDVTGIYLDTGTGSKDDAFIISKNLNIKFDSIDIKDQLKNKVINLFKNEYLEGRTPNPCVICNPNVKFKALFDYADKNNIEFVATGHYAKIEKDSENDRVCLKKANSDKDQSYMLHRLPLCMLKRIIFPLGEFLSKADVRMEAKKLNISVFDKKDSMEICFIPDNDYVSYIEAAGTIPPEGDFVLEDGQVIGRHKGIHHYTVGQGKGLNISAKGRLFVKTIDVKKNLVILSYEKQETKEIIVRLINYLMPEKKNSEFDASVKVRHSKTEWKSRVFPDNKDCAKVVFYTPAQLISPGQSAVFYEGDRVIGGGIIV